MEGWYFDHVDAAIKRGEREGMLLKFWIALQHGDSPRIREYLRNLMLDVGKPEPYREVAGATLFGRLTPEERLREYLSAFETRRMPFEIQVGQTTKVLEQNADRLLHEVAQRVRVNPELADQGAFTAIVESSDRYASPPARRGLGEALQAGLKGSGLTPTQRSRLDGTARFLMQASR